MRNAAWGVCCGGWRSGAGVSAQNGMPGCKIGCRIGPNPTIKCKLDSGQDANKGVLDEVLTSVPFVILHFHFIHFEHSYRMEHFEIHRVEQFQIDQLQKISK